MRLAALYCTALAAFALMTTAISGAAAQSVDGASGREPPEYREIVKQGTQEFELGNFAEARSLFERAHVMFPNARTLRALGLAEFELRNYPAASRHLKEALASDVKPLSAEARHSTESVLRRTNAFLGEVRLEIDPPGATVLLDGQPLENPTEELVLPVGDHLFEFTATGRATQRRTLSIVGGEKQSVRVVLTPLETQRREVSSAGASSDGPSSERRPTDTPVYRKWWLWTTIGVVAAGGVVAAVLLTRRDPEERYVARETPNTPPGLGLTLPR